MSRRIAASRSRSLKASARPRKSRRYGSRNTRSGVSLVGCAKLFEFLMDEVFGSPRNRSPLEEHASDPVAERAYAPPLNAAHLRVKASLDRVLEIEDFFEMAPAHVLGQFRCFLSSGHASTNRIIWNRFGRLKPEP